jgi:hypothetical protein
MKRVKRCEMGRDKAWEQVERLTQESAEAFADFLTTEGVLLDYGSNVGRETPEDALKRFRAELIKEGEGKKK